MDKRLVRKAAFAGSWYPAGESECRRQIEDFIAENSGRPAPRMKAVGGVVPHAGWYFSGCIACRVFHLLKLSAATDPDVIVVCGMHLHPGSPRYIMTEGAWETPLGNLEVDRELASRLAAAHRFVIETPTEFTPDNTVELQLPFIRYFFEEARVVALGVPPDRDAPGIAADAVDAAADLGRRAVVIGSTDLTHYGDNYGFKTRGSGESAVSWVTQENDRLVIEAMLEMDPDRVIEVALSRRNACCAGAAAAAVAGARRLGADRARSVAYATSYEKSPGSSFVGYVGILFGVE